MTFLIILVKRFILDVWQGPEYTSVVCALPLSKGLIKVREEYNVWMLLILPFVPEKEKEGYDLYGY